jgi:ABC-type antimicrobial peptide transport system permease subunit
MKSYLNFLSRNKLYAIIEAFGLAFSLGFIILLVSYAKAEYSIGKNIKDADKIYLLGTGDMFGLTLDTPVEFLHQLPEVESWTRMTNGMQSDVVVGDDYYKMSSVFIDSTFFQLFDYQLTGCDRRQVLTSEEDVLVSASFARKAFGQENALGKRIKVSDENYTICGIVEDFGRNDLFAETDIFFNIKKAYNYYQRMDNFGNTQTFLTLKPNAEPEAVAGKLLDKYMEYWPVFYAREGGEGALIWGSTLTRFDEAYFSPLEHYGVLKNGNKTLVQVLLLVALILLVSACINYVNLTIALTGKRAKEMTMRRVLGEQTGGVLLRYFMEALSFAAFCFLMGYVIAYLFRPMFEGWLSTSIPLLPDLQFLMIAVIAILVISLVSSLLPALLVLHFKPIDVVKGSFQFRNKMVFSKVFIVAQNVISMCLIAVAITMTLQLHHLLTLPLGYQTENLIYIEAWDIGYNSERQDVLRQQLLALPQVEAVGKAGSLPFGTSTNGLQDAQGNRSWIYYSSMDSTAFRLMGFRIVEQFSAPADSLCYIDQETQQRYNISASHPTIDGNHSQSPGEIVMRPRYRVCGVVENYRNGIGNYTPRFEDGHNVIQLIGDNDWSWRQIVKVSGDKSKALAAVKGVCSQVTKDMIGYPKGMTCSYLNDFMEDALSKERNTMHLVLCFMFLSILISALGLFAISVNYSEQHSKEIAISKIMGASVRESVWKLSWQFVLLSLVAVVLATPLCVKAMRYYLQDFFLQIDFPWFVIPLAACITILVVILSILGQSIRIATRNPIEGIKTE